MRFLDATFTRGWRAFVVALVMMMRVADNTSAAEQALTPRLHHLRQGVQEWADFPKEPEGSRLQLRFRAEPNADEWTIRLRQQDVRQTWSVRVNGKELGRLLADENHTSVYFPVPAGILTDAENELTVEQVGTVPDDIRVGDIVLDKRPLSKVVSEATVEITVQEAFSQGKPESVPCRLTVLDAHGALATVGAVSNDELAVRPGVIYTVTGKARFGLPAGSYTIYAGRGFEYSVDFIRLDVRPGDFVRKTLTLRREVPTNGYVSCDTHVHTLSYSGHGDATLAERMLTIAGEGIELPIATDHNRPVDYHAAAVKHSVRRYFTPVVGNEVTTAVGHVNIFPVKVDGLLPNAKLKDWPSLFDEIQQSGAKVAILNHPRDRHSAFRPFGPERHLALTGQSLDGRSLRANAVEVVNSGAQQTDALQLVHDWMALLNRGLNLTPVGSSDSHDVARYIIGQGRTYIRCPDDRPGEIDVDAAVSNFLKGRVLVSCGLLAEITVNDKYGPGDLVPASEETHVTVRILGPSWSRVDTVALYANGRKIREAKIADVPKAGVHWEGVWRLPRFRHDTHLVAVATGPGVTELYWPIARPYQPTSPTVARRVIGVTGAVWLDGDGDGKRSSAYDYARRLIDGSRPHGHKAMPALSRYDEAVALQMASLLQADGVALDGLEVRQAAKEAGPHVERAFQAFAEAWRESEVARAAVRD